MTTADDPNVRTDPTTGEQIVLEPGDEGYVDTQTEEGEPRTDVTSPPPQDLTFVQQPGESDAEFMERQRTTVVESQSPADIVPNMPQIRPFPVDPIIEEEVEEDEEEEGELVVETESVPEGVLPETESTRDTSASALVERARSATSEDELDVIEGQADGRTTVLNAVSQRRDELNRSAP